MPIPDACRHYVDGLLTQARLLLERGEPLAARAFVGHLASQHLVTVRLDDESEASKELGARAIRLQVALLEADFIVILREAWRLPERHLARYDAIIERHGSIGASPCAEDIVAVSLETADGHWMGTAPIRPLPPSRKRRSFGEVGFEFLPVVQGRFVGLLRAR